MPYTMPEGVPTFTPPPQTMMDPRPPERVTTIGSASFVVTVGLILGIVISTGTVIGVVGKAFYVERTEYNLAAVQAATEKTTLTEAVKQMREAMTRQEETLRRLTDDIALIKQDLASMRGRSR